MGKLVSLLTMCFLKHCVQQASQSRPHHLIVDILSMNESSLALVEPTVRILYRVAPVGIRVYDLYVLDDCAASFYFRCTGNGSCSSGEEFTDDCSTESRDVEITVAAGSVVFSAALQIGHQVVAHASTKVEIISREVADAANRYRGKKDASGHECSRVSLINAIIEQRQYSSYLEVGTQHGLTFDSIRSEVKECVDPDKLYGSLSAICAMLNRF